MTRALRSPTNFNGIGIKPSMNFFDIPVPNMERVANYCQESCDTCPHLRECRSYWDKYIAGKALSNNYYRDIPNRRAEEAIDYIRRLKCNS